MEAEPILKTVAEIGGGAALGYFHYLTFRAITAYSAALGLEANVKYKQRFPQIFPDLVLGRRDALTEMAKCAPARATIFRELVLAHGLGSFVTGLVAAGGIGAMTHSLEAVGGFLATNLFFNTIYTIRNLSLALKQGNVELNDLKL